MSQSMIYVMMEFNLQAGILHYWAVSLQCMAGISESVAFLL